MHLYYNREGQKITMEEMAKLSEDNTYRIVRQTDLPDGRFLSSVWLGINHQWPDGPPIIFETMLFPGRKNLSELATWRHMTQEEAAALHEDVVKKITKLWERRQVANDLLLQAGFTPAEVARATDALQPPEWDWIYK